MEYLIIVVILVFSLQQFPARTDRSLTIDHVAIGNSSPAKFFTYLALPLPKLAQTVRAKSTNQSMPE